MLPKYIRARITQNYKITKSPHRKGRGVFSSFNETTEEPLIKYSRKLIQPPSITETSLKCIRTYSPPPTDPILHSNQKTGNVHIKGAFKPSEELMKYNDKKNKMQSKRSVSPNISKSPMRSLTPRPRISNQMEEILQSPINFSEKLPQKPEQVPFKLLKLAILKNKLKLN